jgi:hypothetical protein
MRKLGGCVIAVTAVCMVAAAFAATTPLVVARIGAAPGPCASVAARGAFFVT